MPKKSGNWPSIFLSLLLAFIMISTVLGEEKKIQYPFSRVSIVTDTLHGTLIKDPYRWLEDQQSPETRNWIDAQGKFLHTYFDSFPAMDKIRKQLEKVVKIDRMRLPTEAGGRYFYRARRGDEELYKIYYRDGYKGKEKLLIDPHPLSEDKSTSVSVLDLSDDGKIIAYGVRKGGEDEETAMFMNVDTKEILDSMPRLRYGGASLTRDAGGWYYSCWMPEGFRVYYHQLGVPYSEDKYIFGDGYSSEQFISAGLTENRDYLIMTAYYGSGGVKKNEVWIKDIVNDGPIKPVVTDIDANFYPSMIDNKIYFQTNWNAPNWKIMVTDLNNFDPQTWQDIIPERDVAMDGVSYVGGKIFVTYLENVVSSIKIFNTGGEQIGEVELPTLGSAVGMYGRWNSLEAFYSFESFTYPTTIYRYDIEAQKSSEWFKGKTEIKVKDFVVEQVWFASKDGTQVPMFVVHRKNLVKDGSNPTVILGYGGFNNSETPFFSNTLSTWVNMGGILVVTNLRGGGEFGEIWHRAAMLEKKQNTFDDYIAAIEWMIDNKYTNSDKIAIYGGSNGGLLVGAAMVQRPELVKAVLCSHPLLDMLRYHKSMGGPWWISEYGSADSVNHFGFIRDYSPYHNVVDGEKYPSVLFITGDTDTRVDPMHARKMAALLQAKSGSDNPILIHYNTNLGHAYTTSVSQSIEESAIVLGYFCWQLGLQP